MVDIVIIGAGLSGAVMAERYATILNKKVLVIEKRNHIAGNCYDYIDEETGLLISKYGAHLFHTNNELVWEYLQQFSEWIRYDHKVVVNVDNQIAPIPVNMETINILCNENLQTEDDVKEWLSKHQIPCELPKNSEEIALSRVGNILYEKLFKEYTFKQWNKQPSELDSSVLARIPVRTSMDSRYFSDKYQGLPKHGFTKLVESMLNHPNITVKLNTEYTQNISIQCEKIVYTGPIDEYYSSSGLPKLEYRSLRFELETHKNVGFIQKHMVVNYPSKEYAYTRIIEYKHLPNQKESSHSIIVKEYPSDIGEPYYPVPTPQTHELYEKYKSLADKEPNVIMLGRLASYKYFNMDQAIANSLDYFNKLLLNN